MKTSLTFPRLSRRCAALAAAFGTCIALQPESRAISIYNVGINTVALTGQSGFVAFDLINGDSLAGNNTISITGLATDGVLGNAASFSLSDTNFFNEVLRGITFGTYLSFTLQLTENNLAPGTDQFSLFLLDAGFLPILGTTDPTGAGALFAVDITGALGGNSFVFDSLVPNSGISVVPGGANNVPEGGSTLLFFVVGLFVAGAVGRRLRLTAAP